jgi:GNAT superfamily N-acetyltransferase
VSRAERKPAGSSTADVVVRQANGNDLAAVEEVGRQTWPATYSSIFEEGLVALFLEKKWSAQALTPSIRSGRTLVAEVAGRIVGMASYGPHDSVLALWKLYVIPEAQGRGVGGRLLREVMSHAVSLGRELHISFTDGNASAYEFARSHGFTILSREPQGEMPDLIWMARPTPGEDGCTQAAVTDG